MLAGCLEKNDVNDYRVFIKRFILLVDLAGTGTCRMERVPYNNIF